MKYYVVLKTEDDGWQSDTEVKGVKKTLEEALTLVDKLEEDFKNRHDFENEKANFSVHRRYNYWFYDYNGEWWEKAECIEVNED